MNPESTKRRGKPRYIVFCQQAQRMITSYLLVSIAVMTGLFLLFLLIYKGLHIPAFCAFGLTGYIVYIYDKKLIYHDDHAYRASFRRLLDKNIRMLKHEVKSPVNGIIGLLNLLEQDDTSLVERREMYRLMRKAAIHCVGVANNIQTFDRLLTDTLMIADLSRIDCEKWICDILKLADPDAKKKEISLTTDIGSDVSFFESDEIRITQIMINLIKNAIKFSDNGATVRITVARLYDQLYVDVQDFGRGISADLIEEIFFNKREYEDIEGDGLGLYASQGLARFLGAVIRVKSKKDIGSTFTLIIPVKYTKQ
jgi:signal transduction histidine kinase